MYPQTSNPKVIASMDNYFKQKLSNGPYRDMLLNIKEGDYIFAYSTHQEGMVTKIIRNIYGTPVCFTVLFGKYNSRDHISADRVSKWELYEDWSEISKENQTEQDKHS